MKNRFRHKITSITLALMMAAAPVGGSVFAATDIEETQPEKPVAESYEDNSKIEEYNKKVDDYNKAAKEHNEAVDREYEAAVAETTAKNAEIEQHNASETERVQAAEENNAKAVQEAAEANAKIDEENAAEEARVNEHNSNEDAKVKASEEAKREAEETNEAIRVHNEAVAKYAEDKAVYDEAKAQYEKDLIMEQKILAAGYASVEQYNERINKAYNEPARKSVEMNAQAKLNDVSQTYSIKEASEKSGVNVSVNVKHVFEGTDISYADSFTIDANDTITLKSIGALGYATNPGYATFYFNTDDDHSMGYWCESWSWLETTARHSEYGWNCGDEHEISYSEGKSHANDEEVIDITYYYMWMPLKTYKTYNTPSAPAELTDPGEAKEYVEVPEIYTPNYQTFEKKEYVNAVVKDIAEANILEKIEEPVKRAYIELLGYMDLFEEPEEVIPAAVIEENNDPAAPEAKGTVRNNEIAETAAKATETAVKATAANAAPAAETIADEEVPMADKAEAAPAVTIEDNDAPLAEGSAAWALLNLIMAIVTGIISALLLAGFFGRKDEENEENGEETETDRKGFARLASIIPAVSALIIFLITENMSNPMILTDRWTILMAVILLIQTVIAMIAKKSEEDEDDSEMPEAMNA